MQQYPPDSLDEACYRAVHLPQLQSSLLTTLPHDVTADGDKTDLNSTG